MIYSFTAAECSVRVLHTAFVGSRTWSIDSLAGGVVPKLGR